MRRRSRRFLHDIMRYFSISFDARLSPIATASFASNPLAMTGDDTDDFRVRTGCVRDKGTRASARPQSFVNSVEAAVRKAGGNPSRMGGAAGKKSDRLMQYITQLPASSRTKRIKVGIAV